jgi:hypothetical protein
MLGRNKLASAAMIAVTGILAPVAYAFDNRGPTLSDILQKLEINLENYDRNVPGFLCDEHATSEMFPGTRRDVTITDSVFRLKRVEAPDHTSTFLESRDVKSVNSGPATSAAVDAPAAVDGIFEGALAVVSASQQSCMNYDLRKPKDGTLIIDFKTQDNTPRSNDCLLQEKAHGRAYIDPISLQIKRLELTAPQHLIHNDRYRWAAPLKGEWVVTVEYAPVVLDGRTFWMPSAINSRVTSDPNTFHSRTWIFKGIYGNFHKLEVTSRLLPSQ